MADDTVTVTQADDCPFCGFTMEAYQAFPKAVEGWVIGGDHDDTCPLYGFIGERQCYATRDVATTAWNARVPTRLACPAPDAGLVEMREKISDACDHVDHIDAHDGDLTGAFSALGELVYENQNIVLASLSQGRDGLVEALRPFADFAIESAPADLTITQGSPFAKRQLTMGDCQAAAAALREASQ